MDIRSDILGNRIKLRRKEKNIKQGEMAEYLNISNNHMSSIENGRENPSLDILIKICIFLEVTPDYLLLGISHPNDVPKDITERLRLCSEADIILMDNISEMLVERNQRAWNKKYFI